MVKMADRITNLQPPPKHWTPEKISRYREEACQIHQALKGACSYLAARLQEKNSTAILDRWSFRRLFFLIGLAALVLLNGKIHQGHEEGVG